MNAFDLLGWAAGNLIWNELKSKRKPFTARCAYALDGSGSFHMRRQPALLRFEGAMDFSPEQIKWWEDFTGMKLAEPAAAGPDPLVPTIDLKPGPDPGLEHVRQTAHDTQSYDTAPILKQCRHDFIGDLDHFLDLWFIAATDALAGAPEAEDPASTAGFWIALAGNMLWAATSLMPEAKVVVLAVMSFSGAAVGSGAITPDPDKAPSGKELVSQKISQARDSMAGAAKSVAELAANQCADQKIGDREAQRQLLWRNLYSTGFDKSDPIRAIMSGKINKALKAYNQQWHTWKGKQFMRAMDAKGEREAQDQKDPAKALLPRSPVPLSMDWDAANKKYPFQPELNLD